MDTNDKLCFRPANETFKHTLKDPFWIIAVFLIAIFGLFTYGENLVFHIFAF